MKKLIFLPVLTWLATACSNAPIQPPGEGHLRAEKVSAGGTASIPAPIQQVLSLPAPKPTPKTETYSVVVNNVKVQELLFAFARDAKLNVDIHPGIEGIVTLNAIDQTLQQLLTRISKQVDLRWELDGPNLAVMPDTPFLRTYKVDYVNMSRDVSGTVAISTQIASTSAGATTGASPSNTGGATIPPPQLLARQPTISGGPSNATSKTSCVKQTKFSLQAQAKPSLSGKTSRQPLALARHRPRGEVQHQPTSRQARILQPSSKTTPRSLVASPSVRPHPSLPILKPASLSYVPRHASTRKYRNI